VTSKQSFPIGLSIVIPLKNEEDSVKDLARELLTVFEYERISWEVIFIDDGSTDFTVEKIYSQCKVLNPKVISYFPSRGQSEAIRQGIAQSKFRYIGIIDGDGQNDPADLLTMYKSIQNSPKRDFIQGNRYPGRNDTFLRKYFSRTANKIVQIICGIRLNDLGCATKVFHREVAKQIEFRGEIHRVYAAHAYLHGFRVAEMKVNHRERKKGSSKYGYSRVWKFVLDALFLRVQYFFSRRPIYALGSVSLMFLLTSVSVGLAAIFLRILGIKEFIDGTLVSLSMIMFALAVILFFMAMITDEIMKKDI
jgi:dolichol-phosphate mannosyltransferase